MTFLLDHDVPDDLGYSLLALGHVVAHVRDVLPITSPDAEVLRYANEQGYILLTCNRDDFLELASSNPHAGIIVIIRRKTRAAERAALVQLLDKAGESGISGNINFA
jgi:predicted nuclease of predicted toxin-antitoxin system